MAYMAITTKYLGPTTHRSSRIKATSQRGSLTISWNTDLSVDQNHREACKALATKYGWIGRWFEGSLDNDTNVYVNETLDGQFRVTSIDIDNRDKGK